MEVNVWSSDWGIASIDPRCLQMMTYAKFSGAPLHVRESNNPFWCQCYKTFYARVLNM
jgi:hypothetical protein